MFIIFFVFLQMYEMNKKAKYVINVGTFKYITESCTLYRRIKK